MWEFAFSKILFFSTTILTHMGAAVKKEFYCFDNGAKRIKFVSIHKILTKVERKA